MPIATINPATGETLRAFDALSESERRRSARAQQLRRFSDGASTPVAERAARRRARRRRSSSRTRIDYGRLMTLGDGQAAQGGRRGSGEVRARVPLLRRACERVRRAEHVDGDEVLYQPLGVVLAIMPWNFPFWQVIRFAAPALCAGQRRRAEARVERSAVRARARGTVPRRRCAGRRVSDAARRVGSRRRDHRRSTASRPSRSPEASRRGVRSPATAGQNIKKTVLELGGSDPFIVMPSADIDAGRGRRGESAHDQQRAVVHRGQALHRPRARRRRVHAALRRRDASAARRRSDATRHRHRPARHTADRGGPREAGGRERATRRDEFSPAASECPASATTSSRRYSPTFPSTRPAYRDELFGPVASLFRARDLDDAIRIANDTTLRARRPRPGRATMRRPIASFAISKPARVFINGMVASDPRFPFGGVKNSGYGRELGPVGAARVRERQNR